MKTIIISGGSIQKDFALRFISEYQPDYIIAADRGLAFCMENDIRPDRIMGDFDSLTREKMEEYRAMTGAPVDIFNPVKDATDSEIAIRAALKEGASQIILLGGTGTRLDHVLGNLQCLNIALDAGVPMYIVDPNNRISLRESTAVLEKKKQYGRYVSILAAGDRVEGLTLKGFKYPLQKHTLTNLDSLGVSNEITAKQAEISMDLGRIYLIESRD